MRIAHCIEQKLDAIAVGQVRVGGHLLLHGIEKAFCQSRDRRYPAVVREFQVEKIDDTEADHEGRLIKQRGGPSRVQVLSRKPYQAVQLRQQQRSEVKLLYELTGIDQCDKLGRRLRCNIDAGLGLKFGDGFASFHEERMDAVT